MAATKLWTIEDVERLPDDGYRYELIRGELYRMPPPKVRHGLIANTIGRLIGNFVADRGLGAVSNQSGFILQREPDTLLVPDVAFIPRPDLPENLDADPESASALVVEVVSPSQTGPSGEERVALSLAVGVRLVWVVDPRRRTVHVYRDDETDVVLTERGEVDGEDVLPGFRLPVAQLLV